MQSYASNAVIFCVQVHEVRLEPYWFRNRYDHTTPIQNIPETFLDTCIRQASKHGARTVIQPECHGGHPVPGWWETYIY